MVFSSLTFLSIFLPFVFVLNLVLPSMKAKNAFLTIASLVFYAYGEPIYVVLMLVSSLANYCFGRTIETCKGDDSPASQFRARALVVCAVVINLSFLGVFKYAGMIVGTADALFGQGWTVPVLALPIGISFYTFQAMSYVIDVYRGHVGASKSYSKVLLYISFFPQLIAGPIIKYHDIEEELESRRITPDGVAKGLRRFSVGLAKKVLIANTMAVAVDSIYSADSSSISAAVVWIAALAYIMQIYFDFSGYSDMAIGLARMFGFHYKENFNYPYTSSSITEFWRRWHISLSTWFKEYLYIPLGGNRKGKARASLNKTVVFFCCGLWHGASWTFVIWGLFHGLFLFLEEYLPIKKLPKPLGVVYALLVVTVGFVLFRAESIEQAGFFISQMFTGFYLEAASASFALQHITPLFVVTFVVATIACLPVKHWVNAVIKTRAIKQKPAKAGKPAEPNPCGERIVKIAVSVSYMFSLVLLVLCILSLSSGGYNPFIYFRF